MNKICILVPTYPMHFKYAINFIDSYKKYNFQSQADLFLIFTNEQERNGFVPCQALILPKKLRVMKNNGIINIKKLYGLCQLKEKYEYIIVLDDDCLIKQNVELISICNQFFEEKILLGNILENPPWDCIGIVANRCKMYFNKNKDKQKLDLPLFLWFNQLCIYKTDTLKDFFHTTGICKNLARLTYFDFDYYIYMFYLILYYDFKVYDTGIISSVSTTEIKKDTPYTISSEAYKSQNFYMATKFMQTLLPHDSIFITLHCDRETEVSNKSVYNYFKKTFLAVNTIYRIKQFLN